MVFVRRCFDCRRPVVVYGPAREVLSRHHHYHHPGACFEAFLEQVERLKQGRPPRRY